MILSKKTNVRSGQLIRLDDFNHFSNLQKWTLIRNALNRYNIKPIIGVVPENKDKDLMTDSYNAKFWSYVRELQQEEWQIAIHGYQHVFHEIPKYKQILPFYSRSEFAGLSLKDQQKKIIAALKLFVGEDVIPTIWMAPAHSFDEITLIALEKASDIKIITDGISRFPFKKQGFLFIPSQRWKLQIEGKGIWTTCLHPDKMTFDEIDRFIADLEVFFPSINFLSVSEISVEKTTISLIDISYASLFWAKWHSKGAIKQALTRLKRQVVP